MKHYLYGFICALFKLVDLGELSKMRRSPSCKTEFYLMR